MQISFFEEFPNKENLDKLKYIKWPCKLYVAAKSIKSFLKIQSKILQTNKFVKEVIYWPTLNIDDGYWVSPWTKRSALKKLFEEILKENSKNKKKVSIMLDFEPPKKRWQVISRGLEYFGNRKIIEKFLLKAKKEKIKIYNTEMSHLPKWLVLKLGLGYERKKYGQPGARKKFQFSKR